MAKKTEKKEDKTNVQKDVVNDILAGLEPEAGKLEDWLSGIMPNFMKSDTAQRILGVIRRRIENTAEKMKSPFWGPILEKTTDMTFRATGRGSEAKKSEAPDWKKKFHDQAMGKVMGSDTPQATAGDMKRKLAAMEDLHNAIFPPQPEKKKESIQEWWEENKPAIEKADTQIADKINEFRRSQTWLKPRRSRRVK